MAWTDFYFRPSGIGSNTSAGSTNVSPIGNYTGGGLATVAGTWTFTPVAANPISDGFAVDQWVSIYPDGNTTTPFISKITAVTSTTIQGSSTANKFGTVPSDGAANRSLKGGGPWRSLAMFGTGVALNGSITPGFAMRLNYAAGTYGNTTTAVTMNLVGTTTAPIWHRGFFVTPGDLDTRPTGSRVNGTDIPEWTWTTAAFTPTGAFNTYSNIAITGARTAGAQITITTGGNQRFHRCYLENTGANAASSAVAATSGPNPTLSECYIKATASATAVVDINRNANIHGCVIEGGIAGVGTSGTSAGATIYKTVIKGNTTYGLSWANAGGNFFIDSCTFYNNGTDCIRIAAALPTNPAPYITNNLFTNVSGYGIRNTTGTDTDAAYRNSNAYYACSSGNESGFGDSIPFFDVALAADPFVDAAGGNLALTAVAANALAGIPGLFENQSYTSYLKGGAVQRKEGPNFVMIRRGGTVMKM